MDAGKLDRRITLSLPGEGGTDEYGFPIEIPGASHEVWASYTPVSDAEKIAANEVMATLMARFVVRWSPDMATIGPLWTLAFEGDAFNVEGTKELGRRETVEITATRRAEQ